MNYREWLDKYRIFIGIILIIIIVIGIIFLFWGENLIKKDDNSQDKYAANLELRISELEQKISQVEQGQVAGASQEDSNHEIQEENQIEKVNINTASTEKLDKLPGVGVTRAQYIVEYRESHGGFKTTVEIQNIKGIGPAMYEKMKDMITIE